VWTLIRARGRRWRSSERRLGRQAILMSKDRSRMQRQVKSFNPKYSQ
jgi:hypothetical protein